MRATVIVQRCLRPMLNSVHLARQKALFFGFDALLRGGRLSLTPLGRSAACSVAPRHNIKRMDRLLGNRHLAQEVIVFCAAIAAMLVRPKSRPLLLVDWTRIDDERYALVASLARDGRALPIYFEVHSKDLLSNPMVETTFLEPTRC